jgi:hypothetical protein
LVSDDDEEEERKMNAVIRTQRFRNDRIREYNVNRVISESHIERFDRPLRESSEKYLNKIGKLGARLVRAALRLPGVIEVGIEPYTFRITISLAHGWDSIEPSIIRILKKEVFPGFDPSAIKVNNIQ